MSGSTHGDRKLSKPAVNAISTPNETDSIRSLATDAGAATSNAAPAAVPTQRWLRRWYYGLKYR
ncbi:MAG TPA: hypothetical protein VJN70_03905, partial [Gemmatimonadaceae bacterium]|nr:hypothetical protein [Gemmatimonadaceae bacterium]